MTINGVSQTSGVQRLINLTTAGEGLKVGIRDRKPNADWESTTIPADSLMSVLTDRPEGPQRIAGGDGKTLEVEVRRNEVWLTIGGPDAAVGLDDLMDALAGVLPGG